MARVMMGPPTSWWSSPMPAKPSTRSVSVMATAAASVCSRAMRQTAPRALLVQPLPQVAEAVACDLQDDVRLTGTQMVGASDEACDDQDDRHRHETAEGDEQDPARDVLRGERVEGDRAEDQDRGGEDHVDHGAAVRLHPLALLGLVAGTLGSGASCRTGDRRRIHGDHEPAGSSRQPERAYSARDAALLRCVQSVTAAAPSRSRILGHFREQRPPDALAPRGRTAQRAFRASRTRAQRRSEYSQATSSSRRATTAPPSASSPRISSHPVPPEVVEGCGPRRCDRRRGRASAAARRTTPSGIARADHRVRRAAAAPRCARVDVMPARGTGAAASSASSGDDQPRESVLASRASRTSTRTAGIRAGEHHSARMCEQIEVCAPRRQQRRIAALVRVDAPRCRGRARARNASGDANRCAARAAGQSCSSSASVASCNDRLTPRRPTRLTQRGRSRRRRAAPRSDAHRPLPRAKA